MSSEEPKVTCYYNVPESFGYPILCPIQGQNLSDSDRPAVLMWREDYDAMRNELEELRKKADRLEKLEDYMSHLPFDVDEMIDDDTEEHE